MTQIIRGYFKIDDSDYISYQKRLNDFKKHGMDYFKNQLPSGKLPFKIAENGDIFINRTVFRIISDFYSMNLNIDTGKYIY